MKSASKLLPLNEVLAGMSVANDLLAEKIAVPARDAELELRRLRLAKLFRRCGDGPADKQLFQYLMQYRLGVRHE